MRVVTNRAVIGIFVPPNLVAPFGPPKFYRDRCVVRLACRKGFAVYPETGISIVIIIAAVRPRIMR